MGSICLKKPYANIKIQVFLVGLGKSSVLLRQPHFHGRSLGLFPTDGPSIAARDFVICTCVPAMYARTPRSSSTCDSRCCFESKKSPGCNQAYLLVLQGQESFLHEDTQFCLSSTFLGAEKDYFLLSQLPESFLLWSTQLVKLNKELI